MKHLLTILLSIILTSPAFTNEEVKGMVFVGGKPLKANYKVSKSSSNLFNRTDFHHKTGTIVEVEGPNVFSVDTGSKKESFKLIGLMDMSPSINKKLRSSLTNRLHKKYARQRVKIYVPKRLSDDTVYPRPAYVISRQKLVNSEILKAGLGILPDELPHAGLLAPELKRVMDEAANKKVGLWGESGVKD